MFFCVHAGIAVVSRYPPGVPTLKALIRSGRLVLDEPTELPEGTEVALVPADAVDQLDDVARERLHRALAASEEDIANERFSTADEVLAEIRGQ